jgi:hypothetical protein
MRYTLMLVVVTFAQNVLRPHAPSNAPELSLRLEGFGVEVWSGLGRVKSIYQE